MLSSLITNRHSNGCYVCSTVASRGDKKTGESLAQSSHPQKQGSAKKNTGTKSSNSGAKAEPNDSVVSIVYL